MLDYAFWECGKLEDGFFKMRKVWIFLMSELLAGLIVVNWVFNIKWMTIVMIVLIIGAAIVVVLGSKKEDSKKKKKKENE